MRAAKKLHMMMRKMHIFVSRESFLLQQLLLKRN